VAFVILSFHCTHDLVLGLGGGHGEPQDAVGWEARHASSEELWAREERDWCTAGWAAKR
jgi:hypothetical protein